MMMGPIWSLDLTDQQRSQVNKISDELRRKNWELMGKMQDESAKLRDLYSADKLDRSAISAEYKHIFELRQQRVEAMLDAQAKIDGVLTAEQRNQLKQQRRRGPWWGAGDDD